MNAAMQTLTIAIGLAEDNIKTCETQKEPYPGYRVDVARHLKELQDGLAVLQNEEKRRTA